MLVFYTVTSIRWVTRLYLQNWQGADRDWYLSASLFQGRQVPGWPRAGLAAAPEGCLRALVSRGPAPWTTDRAVQWKILCLDQRNLFRIWFELSTVIFHRNKETKNCTYKIPDLSIFSVTSLKFWRVNWWRWFGFSNHLKGPLLVKYGIVPWGCTPREDPHLSWRFTQSMNVWSQNSPRQVFNPGPLTVHTPCCPQLGGQEAAGVGGVLGPGSVTLWSHIKSSGKQGLSSRSSPRQGPL